MNSFLAESLVVGLLALRLVAGNGGYVNNISKVEPSRCYDCDYDPSEGQGQGQSKGQKMLNYRTGADRATTSTVGQSSSDDRRGFPRCALDRAADDQHYVRETDCNNGICFIRKDHNGLVYRGCADARNLPLGVDATIQCRSQGVRPAVWWFCNGTLCNSGHFDGSSGVCSGQPGDNGGASGSTNAAAGYRSSASSSSSNPYKSTGDAKKYDSSSSSMTHASQLPAKTPTSGMSFESVQNKLGYGGRTPSVYGGTGLSSEQTFQTYSAAAAQPQQPPRNDASGNSPQLPIPPSPSKSAAMIGEASMSSSSATFAYGKKPDTMMTPKTGSGKYETGKHEQQADVPNDQNAATAAGVKSVVSSSSSSSSSSPASVSAASGYQKSPAAAAAPSPQNGNDNSQSASEMPIVLPSGHNDGGKATHGGAYKTWDFVVLAQSRLQRLRDQKFDDTKGLGDQKHRGADMSMSQESEYQPTSDGGESVPQSQQDDAGRPGEMAMSQNVGGSDVTSQSTSETPDVSGFDQCDGQCLHNPSGLFPDPSRPDGFIQCGPGMDADVGMACQCCRPQRMRCPRSTSFDHVTKVCSGATVGFGMKSAGEKQGGMMTSSAERQGGMVGAGY